MSIHSRYDPSLPQAYGGCTCHCHRMPNVLHVMACCSPFNGRRGSIVDIDKDKPVEPFFPIRDSNEPDGN